MPTRLLAECLLRICAVLPLGALQALGRAAGRALRRGGGRARRTTERNIRTCFPRLSEAEVDALARDSLGQSVCTALEAGKAWLPPIAKTLALVRRAEGHGEFRAATESGRGVILLAPHLGNWEIYGLFASAGVPSTFMFQPPRRAGLAPLLAAGRSRGGLRLAPADRGGVARLLAALRRGELVGLLPDQVPADSGGVFAPFFGEPALTMTLAGRLAVRTGARVFCGFARRLPRGGGFEAVFMPAEGVADEDPAASAAALNRAVERCARAAPAQYHWEYKRFRRRPDDAEFYRG